MNLTDVMDYREKTIPAGWYQGQILSGENKESGRTGITGYQIRVELVDYKGAIDEDKFNDPIGYKIRTTIWHPDAEKQGAQSKADSCARALRKFIKAFDVDASAVDEDGFLNAADFVGLEGMVQVALNPVDEDEYKELKAADKVDEYEGDFFPEIRFGGFKKIK